MRQPPTPTWCVPACSPLPSPFALHCPTAAPLCPVRAFTPAFVASQVYAMTCDELWDHMAKFEEKAVLLRVISEYHPLAGRVCHVRALPNSFLCNLYKGAGPSICGVGV